MTLLEPRYERPPEGLAQGRYDAPPWAIDALGAAIAIGALLFLLFRARRARRPSD